MCRITKKAPYGQHIKLICANHPELNWSTKNIGGNFEGRIQTDRSLFFDWSPEHPTECECPGSALILAPEYADLPDVPE